MYEIESKNILTPQNGLNIYRGRTEDSIYLTEIPKADSMDIGIKVDAPELLEGVLRTRRNKSMILMGNLGDPYNTYEQEYQLTRKCLKVIENNDYGVVISTRQSLITRDLDVMKGISRKTKCLVEISFPSLDDNKTRLIEGEEVISVQERFELIETLSKNGIGVIATIYPTIPYINDTEVESIIQTLAQYDILCVDLMDFRLAIKKSVRDFFYTELKKRFPNEYKQIEEVYGQAGELIPEDYKKRLRGLQGLCDELGIIYSSARIKSIKRQYENKTVGEQLTLNLL